MAELELVGALDRHNGTMAHASQPGFRPTCRKKATIWWAQLWRVCCAIWWKLLRLGLNWDLVILLNFFGLALGSSKMFPWNDIDGAAAEPLHHSCKAMSNLKTWIVCSRNSAASQWWSLNHSCCRLSAIVKRIRTMKSTRKKAWTSQMSVQCF